MKSAVRFLAVAAVILAFTLGTGSGTSPASPQSPQAGASSEQTKKKPETPTAPPGTSGARPDIEPPAPDAWTCWKCGAVNPFSKKHYKEMHGPTLAPRAGRSERAKSAYKRAYRMKDRRHVRTHARRGGANAAARLLRQADRLELTGDQRSRLEELAYKTNMDLIDLRAKAQREALKLERAMRAENANMTELRRQMDAVARAQTDVRATRVSCWLESKKLLTEDQRNKIESWAPTLRGDAGRGRD